MMHAAWYMSFVLSILLFYRPDAIQVMMPPPAAKPSTQDTILKRSAETAGRCEKSGTNATGDCR